MTNYNYEELLSNLVCSLPTAAREAYEEAATIMTPQFETQLKTVISALHPLLTLCDYLQNDGISAMQGLIRMGEVYAQIESCELLNGDSLKWIRYRYDFRGFLSTLDYAGKRRLFKGQRPGCLLLTLQKELCDLHSRT